nr:sigma factor [Desulforamulus aquiferis]
MVRQAAFLLGDSVIAEDQVQEAFVRLHRTGIENVEHPVAWLAVVTNNLCYDYMRSEGSRRRGGEGFST